MDSARRLLASMSIQPNETRPVTLLMALYFFLGIAIVLTQTVAFALFISVNGPQMLPYAYLITAVGAALVAFVYLRLGTRLSFPALLSTNLLFLIVTSLIYRVGLSLPGMAASVAIFGLPLWFQAVTNLGNLAFWALTGSLFTVRQGKRLFGLVSTGNWIATIAGGFLASPLITWLGMPNLLVVSAVSLLCALLVLRVILRTCLPPRPRPNTPPASAKKLATPSLFRSRYVVLIFAFLFIWWLGFNIIHAIFSDRAALQFPQANTLGAFLGDFAGVSGILALIMTGLFTAPVVRRYGLWGGLLVMPVVVTLLIAVLALSGTLGASATMLFGLATLTKLINVGVGFGLDQPAHSILYKPLPGHQIGRVPIIAEGIVQPLAVGSAGLILLIFGGLPSAGGGAIAMSYLFVAIGVIWIVITIVLIGVYRTALGDALAKRQLGDLPRALLDQSSVALFNRYLRDPYPGAVVYALHALDQLDQRLPVDVLQALIANPAPDVRRETFAYIERRTIRETSATLKARLAIEPVPEVREAGLRALAATTGDVIADLSPALSSSHAEPADQRGALVGLLRHGGIDGVMLAGQAFNRLLTSTQPEDRMLAGQVMGEVGVTHFYQPVSLLLQDVSPLVRRTALQAAGNIKHPDLWPRVIAACDAPETRRQATLALVAGGESVLPWIERALAEDNLSWTAQSALIQACGRIHDDRAITLLEQQMQHPCAETRTHIFAALSHCGYRAASTAQQRAVQSQIYSELAQAAMTTSTLVNIQSESGKTEQAIELLAAALEAELQQARSRILYLLSFMYDARSILKAHQTLIAMDTGPTDSAQLAYAIELVDTQLPPDSKSVILSLIEVLSPEQRLTRLSKAFPQIRQTATHGVIAVIDNSTSAHTLATFGTWTRACALYAAGELHLAACAPAVAQGRADPEPLAQSMARWAWARLNPTAIEEGAKENEEMLSTVEKVIILKTIGVFAQTPDNVLAEVAELLAEVVLVPGAAVFHKGDPGDSLYLIVYGRVQVRDGERVLRHMGEREVFGEMALLDKEPRSASIFAIEPTQLLRLTQAPFYELLWDRPEIATGIIHVLMGYIRNLNQRLADAA